MGSACLVSIRRRAQRTKVPKEQPFASGHRVATETTVQYGEWSRAAAA